VLPKVLIVASGRVSDSPFTRALGGMAQCRWQSWDEFRPESLGQSDTRLIVAHVERWTDRVALFVQLLQQGLASAPALVVLPSTGDPETFQSISEVAADFLFWPTHEEELRLRASRLLGPRPPELEQVGHTLLAELGLTQLVGNHPAFLQAVQQTLLFANSAAPVLITGETGTGKELFAHAVHSLSRRRDGPFVPLDCGTLPDQLAENELFGHRRGAYTDAHIDQKGLAAIADRGTLFLDEIDALSPANQSKVLRFLQEGTYRALGSGCIMRSDIRMIAATNRPIEKLVQEKQFRSDLYFRINVLRLDLPPLRARRGDVSILARHFLEAEYAPGAEAKTIAPAALRKLERYRWPGNVRELLNAVQRAMVCCSGNQILPEHIVLPGFAVEADMAEQVESGFRSAKQSVIERFERAYVEDLMVRFKGNVTKAAREAGKERRAFGRLIKKYGLGNDSLPRPPGASGKAGHL